MPKGPDAQSPFPSLGDQPSFQNTTALMGATFFKLGDLIRQGADRAGFPQRPSFSYVFSQIDVERGSRLTELAARNAMTPQSMSDIVNEMVARGYLERLPDPEDGRAKRLFLTATGLGSVRAGMEVIGHIEQELGRLLGPDRLDELRESLGRILGADVDV